VEGEESRELLPGAVVIGVKAEYASTTIPCSLHRASRGSLALALYAWYLIWLTAGLIRGESERSAVRVVTL
jgi:hypothetical protein